ncbi:hypothetical protein R3I94_001451 [Phoxinus phoxinus]|jgi:hypothetical protein
MDGK